MPASPLVRIMAAPSEIRLSASPKSRAPHTNGTVNRCLSMWLSSSAVVSTGMLNTTLWIVMLAFACVRARERVMRRERSERG